MKSKLVALFLVIILVVGGFLLWQMMDEDDNNTVPDQTTNLPATTEDEDTVIDQTEDVVDQAEAKTVEISNMAFSPANLTVKKGSTITWTNEDSVAHTVTSDDDGGPLDSGNISNGQTFSFTFNEAGAFAYHCTPHPQMTGTITVVE